MTDCKSVQIAKILKSILALFSIFLSKGGLMKKYGQTWLPSFLFLGNYIFRIYRLIISALLLLTAWQVFITRIKEHDSSSIIRSVFKRRRIDNNENQEAKIRPMIFCSINQVPPIQKVPLQPATLEVA